MPWCPICAEYPPNALQGGRGAGWRSGSRGLTIDAHPRILIAEDHALVREGLQELLRHAFDVADAVGDGEALLRAAAIVQPDAIVLDISMPRLNGFEAAKRLMHVCPGARVVFLTSHADPFYVRAAFDAGGHGYVVKTDIQSIVIAVKAVLAGQRYLSPSLNVRGG